MKPLRVLVFFLMVGFFGLSAQTELRAVENCALLLQAHDTLKTEEVAFTCLLPPDGYYYFEQQEALSAFYAKYPLHQSSCNTYLLPRVNFDSSSVLFFKAAIWRGSTFKKGLYRVNGENVLFLETAFKEGDQVAALNYEWGFYLLPRRNNGRLPRVYTCVKEEAQ